MGSDDQMSDRGLPPGMKWDTFVEAIAKTGFPLQTYATQLLRERGFWVQEEWAYVDEDLGQRRALDLLAGQTGAIHTSQFGSSLVNIEMLVECKRSRHPMVFFESASPPSLRDYPLAIYDPGRVNLVPTEETEGRWSAPASLGIALDLFKLPLIQSPPVAASISIARANSSKVEMSGEDAFRELLLPLTKALRQYRQLRRRECQPQGRGQHLDIGFAVALVDAPMFLVRGSEGVPEVVDKVRMYVRSPVDPDRDRWKIAPVDFVEVIHRDVFAEWVGQDLLAFRTSLEERIARHHEAVLTGVAYIADLTRGEVLDDGVLERIARS